MCSRSSHVLWERFGSPWSLAPWIEPTGEYAKAKEKVKGKRRNLVIHFTINGWFGSLTPAIAVRLWLASLSPAVDGPRSQTSATF